MLVSGGPPNGPTDAELADLVTRMRRHARAEMRARGLGALSGLLMAGLLVYLFIHVTGWLIPAFAGFASGGFVYRWLMPDDLPDD